MRAVFLDLDGCLVDSTVPITRAINEALVACGHTPRPVASLRGCVGPPLLGSLRRLLVEAGEDPAGATEVLAAYRGCYPGLARSLTTVVPDIPEALVQLRDDGWHLDVVTSKPVEYAVPILEAVGLRPLVTTVYGPALDALDEPKATKLRAALDAAGPAAGPGPGPWMVGDRRHDVEAGLACGIGTVGVTWGAGGRAELEAAGATHVVDEPAALPGVLGA